MPTGTHRTVSDLQNAEACRMVRDVPGIDTDFTTTTEEMTELARRWGEWWVSDVMMRVRQSPMSNAPRYQTCKGGECSLDHPLLTTSQPVSMIRANWLFVFISNVPRGGDPCRMLRQ